MADPANQKSARKHSWLHLNLRKLIWPIAVFGVAKTMSHYQDLGYFSSVPEWVYDVALLLAFVGLVYWGWSQDDVIKARSWLYNRSPNILLILLLTIGALLGLGAGAFGYWTVKREHQRGRSSSSISELRFVVDDSGSTVRITVNRKHFWTGLGFLDEQSFKDGFGLRGFPLSVHTKPNDTRPYVDTKLYSSELGLAEVKNNRLVTTPKGWDENSNDRVVEIVNENRIPVFQMILSAANQIDIDAVFSEQESKSGWRIETMFKYPSESHRGELIKKFDFFPLNAKSLYQLFLQGCGATAASHTGYRLKDPSAHEFTVEYMICANLDSKAAYLNVFIPGRGQTAPVIRTLATEYREFLDKHLKHAMPFIRLSPGEAPERAGNLMFTGVIGIYYETLLMPDEVEDLRKEFSKHGATARFYDRSYVVSQNSPVADLR